MRRLADGYQKRFGDLFELKYNIETELARFKEYREKMEKYVVDGVSFMTSAQEEYKKIVVEGANVMSSSQTLNKQCLLTSIGTDA